MALESGFEHGLQHGAEAEIVLRRRDVDRAAKRRRAHGFLLREERRQVGALEPLDAAPQSDKRRTRPLCLHRDEAFDGGERGRLLAREQHLPRECGAIELAERQDVGGHGVHQSPVEAAL